MSDAASTPTQTELRQRRTRLGSVLRDHRLIARMSGEELARRAEFSQPKVSRLETGQVTPNPRDVRKIAAVLGVPQTEAKDLVGEAAEIADLTRTYRREQARIGLAGIQEDHLASEALYATFRECRLGILPGLVQTPEYARSALLVALPQPNDADIAQIVARRVERQAIIFDESRHFDFLVSPETLRMRFGDAEEMYVQLIQLRLLARRSNLTFRVLDLSRPLPTPILTSFTVYDDLRVVVELSHAEVFVSDPKEVAQYRQRFDRLSDAALSVGSSLDLLEAEITRLM